ncbi:AtpZ/AtpI family protein [Desulfolucanica intricata]|uniref:AtpZ/AtpI family protein n=1 Tax=Desulfolucanica intricata TaxID=1285191 RepID=UPI00083280E7|nr:AtpZ/AtpI family protein [Desulfolucanica intricata]
MSGEGKSKALRAMALTSTISVELATTVTLGFLGGRYLDQKLNTDPWLMVTGVLLGVGFGTYGIVQILERFFKDKE